jgi:hypothetical protein
VRHILGRNEKCKYNFNQKSSKDLEMDGRIILKYMFTMVCYKRFKAKCSRKYLNLKRGQFRIQHNEKPRVSCSPFPTVMRAKTRKLRREDYINGIDDRRNGCKIFVGKPLEIMK